MGLFLLIGLFCLLLVIGAIASDDALEFAIKAMVGLVALAFVGAIIYVLSTMQ